MNTTEHDGPLQRIVRLHLQDIDELIELAEMHGWHSESAYERAKAAHAKLSDSLTALVSCAERYEIARRMNPQQWKAAWALNLETGKPFDQIIDEMRPFMRPNAALSRHGPTTPEQAE